MYDDGKQGQLRGRRPMSIVYCSLLLGLLALRAFLHFIGSAHSRHRSLHKTHIGWCHDYNHEP